MATAALFRSLVADRVFEIVSEFAAGRLNSDHWIGQIESVPL